MKKHRGRVQVQGTDMDDEPSFPWACSRPLPKWEALRELETLRNACTTSQLARRTRAFEKASRFVEQGPVDGPLYRTFNDRSLPKKYRDARVDIEVILGMAFT